jgi:hypothetical protein
MVTVLEGEKRASDLNEYRVFILDSLGRIEARQGFLAQDDTEAGIFVALLCDACSDNCAGYELWNRERLVISMRMGQGTHPTLEDISEQRQWNVLKLEETFQQSHWRLSKSKKLLAATEALRKRLGE